MPGFGNGTRNSRQSPRRRTGIPKLACVGGFLGAGKTTAIIAAAERLLGRGQKIGVITNDQGSNLVDSAVVRSFGFPSEEIGGGCFCCRFEEFATRARKLVRDFQTEIILAEAVGSCADLAATVCRRMRTYHSNEFAITPLTAMVDPRRVREMFEFKSFDENVRYLFHKQLAEADLILLTKADLLSDEEIAAASEQLQPLFPESAVHAISAKSGFGLDVWLDHMLTGTGSEHNLDLDYQTYGRAEAALGWLNATFDLSSDKDFSVRDLGNTIVSRMQESCSAASAEVAHIKIMFVTREGNAWVALTNTSGIPAWGTAHTLPPCRETSIIVNARVCVRPDVLRALVERSIQACSAERGISISPLGMESFAPLPPRRPTMLAGA